MPSYWLGLVLIAWFSIHCHLLPAEAPLDVAASVGEAALFPPATRSQILDDHTPFMLAGIPAIDLIDFDYPCWQQLCDNLSQVSEAKLGAVGATVLELIRAERRRLAL